MAHALDTSRRRIYVLLLIVLHLLGAVGVWYAMPGGFRPDHPRFWVNRVLPVAVIAYVVVLFIVTKRRHWTAMVALLLCSPATAVTAAIACAVTFPISGRRPAIALMVFAVLIVLLLRRQFAPWWPTRRRLGLVLIAPFLIGAVLPRSQRAPPAGTRPAAPTAPITNAPPMDTLLTTQRLPSGIRVVPSTGLVMAEANGRSVEIQPLLTFISRSPDRSWTSLAPRRLRQGPRRQLTTFSRDDIGLGFTYADDGVSSLLVRDSGPAGAAIDASSSLPVPIYSHLNTFSEVTVSGHHKLAIAFSPVSDTPIDVTSSQYPVGRPARFAYLDAAGVFRVVEATSGEKGPFHELARGRLAPGEPLTITLIDRTDPPTPFATLTFLDFSAQASTQPSPTAGWGVPVNSIEFGLYDQRQTSPASIFLSLAATSVGRGWDSVGHTAGTYRNRVRLDMLKPEVPVKRHTR